jgi:hypothetical protein
MSEVKIMYWKDIPYGVRAFDENGQVTRQLPDQFTVAIDTAAMVDGDTEQSAYRDGFTWGPAEKREGPVEEVADAVVAEFVAAYPMDRLNKLAQRREA